MRVEIRLPRIGEGEGYSEMTITRVDVAPGGTIQRDDVYMEIADSKVNMELPSPEQGTVHEVIARVGDIKKIGDLLLVVDTADPPEIVKRSEDSANVRTAMQHFASLNPAHLCNRPELGIWTFQSSLSFFEEIVALAREYRHLPLESFGEPLIKDLQKANFFISSFLRQLRGFDPEAVAAARDHATITRAFQVDQEEALRLFSTVLHRARGEAVGPVSDAAEPESAFDADHAYVFISYSHADQEFAQRLADRLRLEHIGYYFDRSLHKGDVITERIHRQLERATHLVVLISPGSERSAWVSYEVGFASARGITLVPYLTHSAMDVPSFLKSVRALKDRKEEREWYLELRSYRRPVVSRPSFFSEWNSAAARERLRGATEVCHQAVANISFLQDCATQLIELVRNGGTLRCVLISPHGGAIRMATQRHFGLPREVGFVSTQQYLAWQNLQTIAKHSQVSDKVKLKVIDYLLEPIMTVVDPTSADGTMFVTLSGFEQSQSSRPSFVLHRSSDPTWFQFYQDSFEKLWAHPQCKSVDLEHGAIVEDEAGAAASHEEELVARIRAGLPLEWVLRYAALQEKRQKGTLTDAEHRDLLTLTAEAEHMEVQRSEALSELARLRGISTAEVANSLGFNK